MNYILRISPVCVTYFIQDVNKLTPLGMNLSTMYGNNSDKIMKKCDGNLEMPKIRVNTHTHTHTHTHTQEQAYYKDTCARVIYLIYTELQHTSAKRNNSLFADFSYLYPYKFSYHICPYESIYQSCHSYQIIIRYDKL